MTYLRIDKNSNFAHKGGKAMTQTDTTESQTQHTPGPWKNWLGRDILGRHENSIDDKPIAHLANPGLFQASPEQEANARLIAAAPDLLAFVEQVTRDVLRNACKGHKAYGVYMDDRCECSACASLRTANELIAKAEGRA